MQCHCIYLRRFAVLHGTLSDCCNAIAQFNLIHNIMALLNINFSPPKAVLLVLGLAMGAHYKAEAKDYTSSDNNIKFGIMGSGSFTWHSIEKDKTGLGGEGIATLFFEYKLAEWFGLRTGVGYSTILLGSIDMKSSSTTELDDKDTTSTSLFKLNRLSIPIVARFYPGEECKFSLYAGLRLGRIFGGKKLVGNSAHKDLKSLESHGKDLDDAEKGFYLSYDFGFDYETNCGVFLGMEGLGFAIGYNFGSLL